VRNLKSTPDFHFISFIRTQHQDTQFIKLGIFNENVIKSLLGGTRVLIILLGVRVEKRLGTTVLNKTDVLGLNFVLKKELNLFSILFKFQKSA